VDDLPWIEIDFEEDIERARREVLPKIEQCR
jgi:choline kinase